MGVEDLTRDELLEEILAVIEPPRPPDNAFCAGDIAAEKGCSTQKAKGMLENAWKAGKLERAKYEVDKKLGEVYYYWVKG